LHAKTPRIECAEHGVKTVELPWARARSGFTLLFEALVLTYARNGMTPTAIGRIVDEHDTRIWRVLEHYVDEARSRLDTSDVSSVGVDETSRAKGHNYITIFVDMMKARVMFATEGKDAETVSEFRKDFEIHGGKVANVDEFSMDMSKAFISGVEAEFPDAQQTFDRFHVIALANDAVDEVRRQEQKSRPELKGSRYSWLKNEKNRTEEQQQVFEELRRGNLKTARAWRLKDTLQKLYDQPADMAEHYLKQWYNWAIRSQLAPMKRLAKTIKAHWMGIMRWFASRLTQGLVEGINGLIQAAKRKARGFRSIRKMIVTVYLVAGRFDFQLPMLFASPSHA
jgi:transposase